MQERYRIAIVADPQLTDWYSYKQLGLSLWLTEFFTDIFMRRSFGRLHREFSPDAVLFLGDLMDGGRETFEQAVYDKNRARFLETVFDSRRTAWNLRPIVEDVATVEETNGIEPAQPQAVGDLDNAEELSIAGHFQQIIDIPSNAVEREAIRSSGKSVRLYVAGNHDTGFGDTMIRKAVRRYKQDFGSINYEITVGNHSLVVLDTLALSANITSITLESEEFLTRMGQEPPTLPRILFTHVPLFRLDSTPCGNARESKQLILDRNGEQYQNLVNATLSRRILRQIQPDMVFSGDDHDWCEIAHSLDSDRLTPEVTVRTFSFAQGIRRPAFVMLSLYNPQMKQRNDATMLQTAVPAAEPSKSLLQADPSALTGAAAGLESGFQHMSRVAMVSQKSTFAYEECMLPDQLAIYIGYAALFGVSLVWLLILRWRTFSQSHHHSDPLLVRWRQQLQYASHSKPRHAPTKATNSTTLHPFDVEETNESRGSTTGMQLSPSMTSSQEKFMTLSDDLLSDRENEQEEAVGGDEKEDERLSLSFNRQGKTLSSLSPITTGKGFHGQGWQGGRGVDMWAWMRYRVEQAWWQWPVRSPAFWQLLGLDHLDIARLVVPFYVFLLLISLL
ncbi:hypothetical protein EDD11_000260 [Mortierella claussenii]|nr:hypothetical protein EDD11_000260 [Mortierella claussenii]